jgi:hypothetical protein
MNESIAILVTTPLVAVGACAEAFLIREFLREASNQRADRVEREASGRLGGEGAGRALGLAGVCELALAVVSGAARAQTTDASDTSGAATVVGSSGSAADAPFAGSAIGVQINLDYATAYYFRGIVQEDAGLIIQPSARLTANLGATDDCKLDAFIGTWNSFQGQKTDASTRGDFTEYWYESDLYGGLVLTAGKWSLTTSYTFLTSPSDAYETVQELGLSLAFNDAEWLREWSLKPYATVAIETGADASDGADSDAGTYLELGIGPAFSFNVVRTPVTLVFPVAVGLSLSDYYQDSEGDDDTLGFAQVGARASIPLGEPGRLGAWTLNAGVSLLVLGDHTSEFNGGDETEVIGTLGLQVNF